MTCAVVEKKHVGLSVFSQCQNASVGLNRRCHCCYISVTGCSGHLAVGDDQIEIAVVFRIKKSRTEPGVAHTGGPQSGTRCGILKASAGNSPVHGIRFRPQMCHQNIGPQIAIDITDGDPHAGFRFAENIDCRAHDYRLIGKRAVPAIDPKIVVLAIVGNQDIGRPVHVEIQRYHTEALAGHRPDAGYVRHICKVAVAVVMK